MKRTAGLVLLLAGALLGAQAHAQARGGTGGYFGAGVMQVSTDNATDFARSSLGPPNGSADGTATGFKVYGGYIWPARFGIEAGFYDLGTFDVYSANAKSDEFKTTALAFSGIFALPINPSVDVQFKLGLAFTDADYRCFSLCGWPNVNTSHSDIAALMGIGVDWRLAANFSVRADFEYFGGVVQSIGGILAEYDYTAVLIAGQLHF